MKNLSWLASSAVVVAVGAVLATPNDAAACRLTVGDRVWYDANNNGIQDSDEAGINGVRLTIDPPVTLPDWTVVSQAVTGNNSAGAAGFYQFNSVKCNIAYT